MFSDPQLASASAWTYLTKREKSDILYHYTIILVKDHLAGLEASILDKLLRTSTTKWLRKISPSRINFLKLQLVSTLLRLLEESLAGRT